jgi:hypothetical protein
MYKSLKLAVLLAVSLVMLASSADADGLFLKLPEDGTKVSYSVKISGENPPPAGFKMALTISSVGKVQHEGKACRWIEVAFLTEVGEMRRDKFHKLLIPEAQLKKGGNPIGHLVKAYRKQGDGPAVEDKQAASARGGPLPVLLGSPVKDAKKLEVTTLETGLGTLETTGFKGTAVYTEAATEGDGDDYQDEFKLKMDTEFRTHDKVPFGVAQAVLAFKVDTGNRKKTGVLTFTVDKVSTGATSALPDSK